MKVIIETHDDNVSSIEFKQDDEQIQWIDISREEQLNFLQSLVSFGKLFSRCVKQE